MRIASHNERVVINPIDDHIWKSYLLCWHNSLFKILLRPPRYTPSAAAGTKIYLTFDYMAIYRAVASRVGLSTLCWYNLEHNRYGLV